MPSYLYNGIYKLLVPTMIDKNNDVNVLVPAMGIVDWAFNMLMSIVFADRVPATVSLLYGSSVIVPMKLKSFGLPAG